MTITLNGKTREIDPGTTIEDLLNQLRLDLMKVVVELNRNIIPRQRLGETTLSEGDILEIVHFVGGG